MNKLSCALVAAFTALGLAESATAQTYPSRPVTLLVPFSAGGPSDTVARVVAQGMSQPLGQSVIIENLAGAAGTIATARLARAAPDGYTLGEATWSTHVVSPVVYRHLSYNVLTDFAPVALLTETPLLILSRKAIPANDLKGLVVWLKAHPNAAFQGVAGGTDQVAGFFFQKQTGTRFQYVPYRGLALAMQDLVAGRIDLLFDQPSDALPQIRTGNIKVYAVTAQPSAERCTGHPDGRRGRLAGDPSDTLAGDLGAEGHARAVIAKLNAAAMVALADPALRKRLAGIGQEVVPREQQTPAALGAYYKAETDKWWPIIKAAGLKTE